MNINCVNRKSIKAWQLSSLESPASNILEKEFSISKSISNFWLGANTQQVAHSSSSVTSILIKFFKNSELKESKATSALSKKNLSCCFGKFRRSSGLTVVRTAGAARCLLGGFPLVSMHTRNRESGHLDFMCFVLANCLVTWRVVFHSSTTRYVYFLSEIVVWSIFNVSGEYRTTFGYSSTLYI